MFPQSRRTSLPRLNDAMAHGAKVCVVAYESDANIYGVRRQAKRDAALACFCAASISRDEPLKPKRRRVSLAAALHSFCSTHLKFVRRSLGRKFYTSDRGI